MEELGVDLVDLLVYQYETMRHHSGKRGCGHWASVWKLNEGNNRQTSESRAVLLSHVRLLPQVWALDCTITNDLNVCK